MHWPGHVGAALLLYLPGGVAATGAGEPTLAAAGAVLAAAVSTLPDVDQRLPIDHRGHTHTVWFLLAAAVVAAALGAPVGVVVGDPAGVAATAGAATALSVCSHILADSLTPMGVRPFAPVWNRHWSFGVTLAANRRANLLLLGAGLLSLPLWQLPRVA